MRYIIADVEKKESEQIVKQSYVVDNQSVSYVNKQMDRLSFLRMRTDGFFLTPGFIMNDFDVTIGTDYLAFKERMIHLINEGCTTVISYFEVPFEKQFASRLKKARHSMINSTIDYMLGVKIPSRILTTTIIQKCKREKVPILLVALSHVDELNDIPWQWLKEAMMTYQLLIIPSWEHLSLTKRQAKYVMDCWREISAYNRIPTIYDFPEHLQRLGKIHAQKIGLYPKKGDFKAGSDVDYNLFKMNNETTYEETNLVKPDVVVLRGRVLKAGSKIELFPGFGKEITISIPGRFIPISEAYGANDYTYARTNIEY